MVGNAFTKAEEKGGESILFAQFDFSIEAVMARTPKESKKGAKKNKKSVKKKSKILCENCGKCFSKVSNLNAHIEKVHKGLRWSCHICGKHQVTKHSHLRHYRSQHNNELPVNIDANQRYANSMIDMPEKAKNSIIKELNNQIKAQKVLLKSFRKRLLIKLKENIELKARLNLN